MENFLHQKVWNSGTNPAHVEPPPILLVKKTHNGKPDKDFIKLKLRRYNMSSTMDLYEFNMYFFDQGEPEELLLFIRNFNMTLLATGTM